MTRQATPLGSSQKSSHLLTAMVLEATARKPGNVHPGASFSDMAWPDFAISAIVTAPILAQAAQHGVGHTVLACVEATHAATGINTNLGMLLLLAPLAAAEDVEHVQGALDQLNDDDARAVYAAIALAKPGGLGRVEQGDVNEQAVLPLIEAMSLASTRDQIARQYVTGFDDVLTLGRTLADHARTLPLDDAIVLTHLSWMATQGDTLIARKAGQATANRARRMATKALEAALRGDSQAARLIEQLDDWLRRDGHRRNPGTSADLIAAALYVALHKQWIALPSTWRENLWS